MDFILDHDDTGVVRLVSGQLVRSLEPDVVRHRRRTEPSDRHAPGQREASLGSRRGPRRQRSVERRYRESARHRPTRLAPLGQIEGRPDGLVGSIFRTRHPGPSTHIAMLLTKGELHMDSRFAASAITDQKNASVRISMLSRGRALGGEVGSSKAVCADQRARPSFAELNTLNTIASSRRMRGNQNHLWSGL